VVGECEMSRCVRFKGRGQWLNNCEKIVSFSKASSQYWGEASYGEEIGEGCVTFF